MIKKIPRFNVMIFSLMSIGCVDTTMPVSKEAITKAATLIAFHYGATLVHELSHAIAVKAFGGTVHKISLSMDGLRGCAKSEIPDSFAAKVVICVSGPLAGAIFCAAVCRYYKNKKDNFSRTMQYYSFLRCATTLFSLIPLEESDGLESSDGYKILSACGVRDEYWADYKFYVLVLGGALSVGIPLLLLR